MSRIQLSHTTCISKLLCALLLFSASAVSATSTADGNLVMLPPQFQPDTKITHIDVRGCSIINPNVLASKALSPGTLMKDAILQVPPAIARIFALDHFSDVRISVKKSGENEATLVIAVEEDPRLSQITFKGNKHLKLSDIEPVTGHKEWKTVNDFKLEALVHKIEKLYQSRSYPHAKASWTTSKDDKNSVAVEIQVDEGKLAHVRRVQFTGNDMIASQSLANQVYSKEVWPFSFMDRSGIYSTEMINVDKLVIENVYQNNGFLEGHVKDVITEQGRSKSDVDLTFVIEEGPQYLISNVEVTSSDILTKEEARALIPLAEGQLYSRERIRQAMEILRTACGNRGYVFADITPSFLPNRENKTVAISFAIEGGEKMFMRRVMVTGNRKTCDYVVRRVLNFDEGDLLTSAAMDGARSRIERLGYFDQRGGVSWEIAKINESQADLILKLQEIKTGKFQARLGFGGDDMGRRGFTPVDSPGRNMRIGLSIGDINFLGRGISYTAQGSYSKRDRALSLSIFNPWLFNRPFGGGADVYHRKMRYDDMRNVKQAPLETTTGGGVMVSYLSPEWYYINTTSGLGYDNIHYTRPEVRAAPPGMEVEFQALLDRKLQSGDLVFLTGSIEQDRRNHPTMPNRGYHWTVYGKLGLGPHHRVNPLGLCESFGFFKTEFDAHWYTPLINEYDLIFHMHGHLGLVGAINNRAIPFKELFHIGGPGTVRGFTFGQISPSVFGDSVGAQYGFFINSELLFPIRKDNSIRGVVFYDGGAGWHTPDMAYSNLPVRNNNFEFRHAVGVGIRMTVPTPLRVDIGFKLDRKKRAGERLEEIHFNMSHDF
jgi:outer membrane protein insertion porin family